MARLGSQAKAGFYPTPDSVCDLLKQIITYEEGARILDPCCGAGEALAALTQTAPEGVATYGIELDHGRATLARPRLNEVLWCDALQETRYTFHAFGLLFLNPPYDTAITPDEKAQRFETLFLRSFIKALQPNGFLVFIIPYYVLANQDCAQAIARNFNVQVLGFPEADFQAFKQCIVLGKRQRVTAEQAETCAHNLMELGQLAPEAFLREVEIMAEMAPVSLVIPAASKPLVTFKSSRLDPTLAIPLIRKAGVLGNMIREIAPQQRNTIRPLGMLENGHMALLLAGGFMNGEIEKDGRRLVIKGVVRKITPIVATRENEKGKGGAITTRDKYIPTVKVIDMQSATIQTIQ